MAREFDAKYCHLSEQEGYSLFSLSDEEHEPSNFIIVQFGGMPDQQDIDLSMDKPYFEFGENLGGFYAEPIKISLTDGKLEIFFSDADKEEIVSCMDTVVHLPKNDAGKLYDMVRDFVFQISKP